MGVVFTCFKRQVLEAQEVDCGAVLSPGFNQKAVYDTSLVRELILERRLAPFYPEQMNSKLEAWIQQVGGLTECPICMVEYPINTNFSDCCSKPVCTDCFVQFHRTDYDEPVHCPYCASDSFSITYSHHCKKNAPVSSDSIHTQHLDSLFQQKRTRVLRQHREALDSRARVLFSRVAQENPSARMPHPDDLLLMEAIRQSLET